MGKLREKGITVKDVLFILMVITAVIVGIQEVKFLSGSSATSDTSRTSGKQIILVITGSMEPAIRVNSLSVMEYCSIQDIKMGDIVVYNDGGPVNIAHRVVEIYELEDGTNDFLVTQGDANPIHDQLAITDDMLVGKVVKTYNWVAPYITKIMVSEGKINSIILARYTIILLLILSALVFVVYNLADKVILYKISKNSQRYKNSLNRYEENINKHLEYLSQLRELAEVNDFKTNVIKTIALKELQNFDENSINFKAKDKIIGKIMLKQFEHTEKDDNIE